MRPRELICIIVGDIAFGTNARGPFMIICIQAPKTRRFFGRIQHVLITDAPTIAWVQWLISGPPPHVKLWTSSRVTFANYFRTIFRRIGLEHLPLTPASLRAGGAAHLIMEQWDSGRVQFLDRWVSTSSLAAYIQEAMAHVTMLALSARERNLILELVKKGRHTWRNAPRLARSLLFSRTRQLRRPHRRHEW